MLELAQWLIFIRCPEQNRNKSTLECFVKVPKDEEGLSRCEFG